MANNDRWQVYPGTPNRKHNDGMRVTLSPRKVLLLNKAAYDAIGTPDAVEMRYDENTRTMGIYPRDIRHSNSFPFRKKTYDRYNYRLIHAAPFCKHFGISPSATIQFSNVDLDNDGTMLLELSTAVIIGRGMR